MGELKFQKLTPTQEADLSGYEDAFHYIFAEDDIRNIAISGAYSSGKSSVIESYKKKHPNKIFLHLSLAHFQALDDGLVEEKDSDDIINKTVEEDSENIIEGKILNQLIQQIPAEKIPQTNFRIKRSIDWRNPTLISLQFMRNAYPDQILTYIRNDVDRYISVVTVSDFSIEEMEKIIEWPEVDDQKKVELLELTDEPVSLKDKPFSDELLIYVMDNNLYEPDMPWLLQNYSGFSDEVKEAILQVASNMVNRIASTYPDDVDGILLDLLFRSERVGFEEKILLLEKTARKMSREELCNVLRYLEADKIADNISDGKKRVRVTEESN